MNWSFLEVVILRLIIIVVVFIVSVPPSDVERLEKVLGRRAKIMQHWAGNRKEICSVACVGL